MYIGFDFSIDFSSGGYVFKDLLTGYGRVFGHKYWEFQAAKIPSSFLFGLGCSLTSKRDHAGFRIETTLFGLFVEFQIYDHRHWDYKKGEWIDHEEDNS